MTGRRIALDKLELGLDAEQLLGHLTAELFVQFVLRHDWCRADRALALALGINNPRRR